MKEMLTENGRMLGVGCVVAGCSVWEQSRCGQAHRLTPSYMPPPPAQLGVSVYWVGVQVT